MIFLLFTIFNFDFIWMILTFILINSYLLNINTEFVWLNYEIQSNHLICCYNPKL
jgi:hypothetical protein